MQVSQPAGWGSIPENRTFLAAYVRTRDVLRTTYCVLTLVLPPAVQKTSSFQACLSQRLRDAVLRIVLTLVRTDDDCVLSFRFQS